MKPINVTYSLIQVQIYPFYAFISLCLWDNLYKRRFSYPFPSFFFIWMNKKILFMSMHITHHIFLFVFGLLYANNITFIDALLVVSVFASIYFIICIRYTRGKLQRERWFFFLKCWVMKNKSYISSSCLLFITYLFHMSIFYLFVPVLLRVRRENMFAWLLSIKNGYSQFFIQKK